MLTHYIALAATIGYLVASIAYIAHFLSQHRRVGRAGSAALYVSVGLHLLWLVLERIRLGYPPFAGAHQALSFVAFAIALVYSVIEVRFSQRALGAFIIPVACLLQVVAGTFPASFEPKPLPTILQSGWFEVHVTTALFSYCAFAVAFAAGLMYILLCHELRLKHLGFFFRRMPPLDILERTNYHAIALGFIFLTVGIATGVIWSLGARPGAALLNAKEISAVVIWLLYAANIHLGWRMGWRGQRTALFSVANFAFLFALFCVTSLLLGEHRF